jgi:hypothetical protein
MKKGIILTFCLLFLTVPCSFAGDDFIFAPVISAPEPGEMDSYVISGDNGSEVFHVFSLEPVAEDSYLVVGPNGESNVIIKMD